MTATKELVGGGNKVVQKVTVPWTSDASGNYTEVLNLFGFLLKAVTIPSGGGTAPTALYDITLVQNGVDNVGGILADRAAATTELVNGIVKNGSDISQIPPFLAGDHTFTVANAGNAKAGTCILYLVESL